MSPSVRLWDHDALQMQIAALDCEGTDGDPCVDHEG